MQYKQYQVDAFTTRVFAGNPAAVCLLDEWLPDEQLQAIAQENNLSETAFVKPSGKHFDLRWFTPVSEVDLCGHATLATAHALLEHCHHHESCLRFHTRSGELSVKRHGMHLQMNFPSLPAHTCSVPETLVDAFSETPREVLAADDYLLIFDHEDTVRALQPDFGLLQTLDRRGVIATAPGEHSDFVSRFFAPKFGIPEDPVTGSAHCTLTPYWANQLNKQRLSAHQVSARGGHLLCELSHDRVLLSGHAVTFMEATIYVS